MSTSAGRPWSDAVIRALADASGRLVIAAVDDEPDAIDREVNTVIDRYGAEGVYGLCNGLAAAFKAMTVGGEAIGGAYLRVFGAEPDELPAEALPMLWATRFLAAHLNDDGATKRALFVAPLNTGQYEDVNRNLNALINIVGETGRARLAADRHPNPPPHQRKEYLS